MMQSLSTLTERHYKKSPWLLPINQLAFSICTLIIHIRKICKKDYKLIKRTKQVRNVFSLPNAGRPPYIPMTIMHMGYAPSKKI